MQADAEAVMRLPKAIDRLHRRWFGRFEIDDPRPVAEQARYTFYLPSENELLALQPGDLAKIIFRSMPPAPNWGAERMWVIITEADGDRLIGTLDNDPSDMPQLRPGQVVHFKRSNVIDLDWGAERAVAPPPSPKHREYWDRCMVDDCVLQGRSPVDYLYREEPDAAETEELYPDSGWRIRGTDEAIMADEKNERSPLYVALAAVLNRDDK
ncbi:hypothetical protein ACVWZA_001503 [Sphingomonas sp. UYAg733]